MARLSTAIDRSEAQLDRFIARVRLGYLDAEGEA
jgi:hypothetical protein